MPRYYQLLLYKALPSYLSYLYIYIHIYSGTFFMDNLYIIIYHQRGTCYFIITYTGGWPSHIFSVVKTLYFYWLKLYISIGQNSLFYMIFFFFLIQFDVRHNLEVMQTVLSMKKL